MPGPTTDEFRAFVASGWAPRRTDLPERTEVAPYAAERRAAVSAAFPGERLVIPAGGLKVRSNDTDYVFRPHSAFAHLTGLGGDREADAVLVLEPTGGTGGGGDGDTPGHEAILYFRPLAGRDTDEFFGDSRYGEFWVGARPTIEDIEAELGITARHIDEFADAVAKDAGQLGIRVVREADPAVAVAVDKARAEAADAAGTATAEQRVEAEHEADDELSSFLSHLRMIKDEWEIEEMRSAIEGTHRGFEAVIADLPEAIRRGRGERWVEGVFGLHARHHGNGVGYDSICASGDHANTLHWIKNSGEITEGDLLLLDAGVEVDSLFTADITRTLPVSGTFSEAQRRIYDAVYAAQEAGIAACKPGNRVQRHPRRRHPGHRRAPPRVGPAARGHRRRGHARQGARPVPPPVDGARHEPPPRPRRPRLRARHARAVHGRGARAGDDPHRRAGPLLQGRRPARPAEFRGNGVRIEDDILITEDGCENLSAAMPRTADDVEAWIARIWSERG